MGTVYKEVPDNWRELEPYVSREGFIQDIFRKKKCFFYDACSFRYHANMDGESIDRILAYIKEKDGIIVITRCILMELASSSGILNQEYIQYFRKISQSGLSLYVIYEEDLFQVMEICFSTHAAINNFLVWSVRMMRGPVSTITKTLNEDGALSNMVIKGRNLDNREVYRRFFSSVRANKESGDNLGEELLGICLHILSQLPGEEDGKFCVITDDKNAAGKIDGLFKKTNRQFRGKKIILFSTPKLAQILYGEGYVTDRDLLIEILKFGGSGNIKVLGTRIYDLRSSVISLSREEMADQMISKGIHIIF
ncbi:MAG TPA: hypothetical protein IAB46_05060 [Candidatus Scybalocola faecigallinarum]|uniref:Uncharacterized protein n=1 Tax=Candidatus Scybalocola faecigallinarum TaxID=2840941 RepID=A0A9D1F3E1_9FIRM|nr:hypothetical protein [Candidatus Scybalocola faecigallinarum]